ncbi:hypothetical protein BCV69DRAFT_151752 [Microstroma glucosiphilum]|uniref:Uncharacterized protein n=1 Tax=Pseudomicrostroma glucosiphilum TaxID=1684307 RepID=A0A316U8T5_9BASI|nr:hypothetical protein BCV69DRAFT_151752 [Pseudomicrostroma glucosiphilum]PWN21667.1 hypothetical protein BCV69DRAFT_151752 [Pseudomicrostroma glucosiphilum]
MHRHRAYVEEEDYDHQDQSVSMGTLHNYVPSKHVASVAKKSQMPRPSSELDAGLRVPNWGPPIPSSTGESHRIGMEGAFKVDSREEGRRDHRARPSSSAYMPSSPGIARASGPMSSSRYQSQRGAQSSPYRRPHHLSHQQAAVRNKNYTDSAYSSGSSSSGGASSEDEAESPFRPHANSRESTGNHRALAASSVINYETLRPISRPALPRDALDRLDQWAASASASASDSERSNVKHQRQQIKDADEAKLRRARVDSCDPTYEIVPKAVASSPARSPLRSDTKNRHAFSPGSPSPAPTLRPDKGPRSRREGPSQFQTPQEPPTPTTMSAFADLAGQIGRDLMGVDEGMGWERRQASKATRDSSAETLVEEPQQLRRETQERNTSSKTNAAGYTKFFGEPERTQGQLLLPSGVSMGRGAHVPLLLPEDVTGLTSALESPVKSRLGVRHATLHPSLGKAGLGDRKMKLADLKEFVLGIEEELELTKERLEGVESRGVELRDDLDQMRNEWRHGHLRADGRTSREDEKRYADKISAMSQHITTLSHDLTSYRAAVEEIQHAKLVGQQRQSRQRPVPDRHVELQKGGHHGPETYSTEFEYRQLQEQILHLEDEVKRLHLVVEGHNDREEEATEDIAAAGRINLADQRHLNTRRPSSRSKQLSGARHATRSSPARAESQTRRLTFADQPEPLPGGRKGRSSQPSSDDRYSDSQPAHSSQPAPIIKGTSMRQTTVASDEDEGNETPRPSSAQSATRSRSRARSSDKYAQDEDEDVTQAQTRVDQTTRSVFASNHPPTHKAVSSPEALSFEHDAKNCTVCLARSRKETHRTGRRQRVMDSIRQQEGSITANEEDLLLSLLQSSSARQPLSGEQESLLQRLIKQHIDEFLHARMLYAELADELKKLHPEDEGMTSEKRKILVEHVLESVEELEARCGRIEGLKRLRSAISVNGRSSPPTTDAVRSSSGNPLLGGKSKRVSRVESGHKGPTHTTLSRALANSPPLVDRVAGRK